MDKQDVLENIASMSVGASSALAVVPWIEGNATLITMFLSLSGVLIAATAYWYRQRLNNKEYELKLKIFEYEKNNDATRIKKHSPDSSQ